MARSIRQTLTLWYVGILAVILCVFSWVLYSSLHASLIRDVDRTLALQAGNVADTIHAFWEAERAAPSSAPGNWQSAPSATLQHEVDRGRFPDLVSRWAEKTGGLEKGRPILLLDVDGRPIAVSESFARLGLPQTAASVSRAVTLRHTMYETLRLPDGRVRLITRPILEPAHYVIQAATPLSQVDASLHQLRLWLGWLIPLTLIITSSVGLFLATTALRPVAEMIAQAQRISAERLDERIPVAQTGDELQRLGVTFNDMLARLESTFHRLRQFSAAASHELRTPLTVMRGELEVALRKPRDQDEYQRVLHTHLETVNDMAHTVEELLTLARSESVDGAIDWRPVELSQLARQVSETWRRVAGPKSVTVEVPMPEQEPVWVRGEPRLLERIIANLLDNALRHTPPKGRVTLRTERQGQEACLIVEDTGPGIASEEMPQIFNRFFKPWSKVDGSRSTGLGLGLCRWIAEAHHGRIEVSSPPGRGATFVVWLPLIPAPS